MRSKFVQIWATLLSTATGIYHQYVLQTSYQQPLFIQPTAGPAGHQHDGIHVKNTWQIHHLVNISVGTPPQVFQLALQTGPTLPLLIPSSNCDSAHGCDGSLSNQYNSSLSSSYKPGSESLSQEFNNLLYKGRGSRDRVLFNGVTVQEVEFLEWTEKQDVGPGIFNFVYDGVISLPPPWYQSGNGPAPLLVELDSHGNLDAKMFSLELSTVQNGTGMLTIGAKDHLMDAEKTVKLPIVQSIDNDLVGLWTAPIKSMAIQYESKPRIELPFPGNYTALLDPGRFRTSLPRHYGIEFLKMTGAKRVQWANGINCALLDKQPDLIFTFEPNQTVIITPKDYVLRMEVLKTPLVEVCTIAIDDVSEHEDLPDDVVVLGSSFLRAFHSIWDWENRQVGLAPKPF